MQTFVTNGCPHCGMGHTGACPRVRAVEYYPDGQIKRVEYFEYVRAAPEYSTTPVVIAPIGNDLRKPQTT